MLSERRPQKEKKPAENNPSGEKSRARNLGRNLGSTVNLLMMWATLFRHYRPCKLEWKVVRMTTMIYLKL